MTDQGAIYTVYFVDGSAYIPDTPFSDSVLMVGFYQHSVNKLTYEKRVGATIIDVVRLTFSEHSWQVLVYVFDTKDGKQRGRMKLFAAWFERANDGFVHLTHQPISPDFEYYSGLLMRSENPWREQIVLSAQQFLSDKFGE